MVTRRVFSTLPELSTLFPISFFSGSFMPMVSEVRVLELMKSDLRNRCVKIKVNDCYSDESHQGFINSGVPQGSILGPLLFFMYINDVSDELQNCMLYLYADGCSIFCPVDPHNNQAVAHDLIQSDLNRLTS
jgi:hypothetical protein